MAGATVKEDGISGAIWLINLSAFTSAFYKKYALKFKDQKQELLTPMMNYILKQLSMENVHQLLLLKDILERTAGVKLYDKAHLDQIFALEGMKPSFHVLIELSWEPS